MLLKVVMLLDNCCRACGALLRGGSTVHKETCPFYAMSWVGQRRLGKKKALKVLKEQEEKRGKNHSKV